jgi:hypothetical protein
MERAHQQSMVAEVSLFLRLPSFGYTTFRTCHQAFTEKHRQTLVNRPDVCWCDNCVTPVRIGGSDDVSRSAPGQLRGRPVGLHARRHLRHRRHLARPVVLSLATTVYAVATSPRLFCLPGRCAWRENLSMRAISGVAFKDPGEDLRVEVVGRDPFDGALDRVLAGKTVALHRVVVIHVSAGSLCSRSPMPNALRTAAA